MAGGDCLNCGGNPCRCVIVDDPEGCVTVTGSGQALDPYVISGPCITCATVAAVFDEVNVVAVATNNDLLMGLIGGLGGDCVYFDPPPPETVFTGIASGLVTIAPGGVNGHAPTIGVSCEAVQACVAPLIPAYVAPVAGCGIAIAGDGTVSVRTSGVWAFPCLNTLGAPTYCDDNGQIRTVPEHTSVTTGRSTQSRNWGAVGTGTFDGTLIGCVMNNPSTCRSMIWNFQMTAGAGADGTSFLGAWGQGIYISASPGYVGHYQANAITYNASQAPAALAVHTSNNDTGTVGPGGTVTINSTGYFQVFSGAIGAPGLTVTSSALIIGVTI